MILHLLKTDWQRLRWPTLGLWLLMIVSASPWLFHSPETFTAPWWYQRSWNGRLTEFAKPNDGSFLQIVSGIKGIATFGLSTAIGLLGVRWQGAMPLSRWKAIAAKHLAIFFFIILPQFLLGALVMFVQHFPIATIIVTGSGITLSLLLLHSVTACFARLCASGWTWIAGISLLQGLVIIANQLFPGRLFDSFFTKLLFHEKGPHLWALCSVALAAMFVLPKLMRTRPGKPAAVAAAVIAMITATIATPGVPAAVLLPTTSGLEATSLREISVAPSRGSVRIDDQAYSGRSNEVRVSVTPVTTGELPPGTFVVWTEDEPEVVSPYARIDPYPNTDAQTDRAALEPVLPAPLAPWPRGHNYHDRAISLTTRHDELSPESELSIPVNGHVFHYEPVADFDLSENSQSHRSGPFTFIVRQIPATDSMLLVDLVIQGPENSLTRDGLELCQPGRGAEGFRIILHAPANKLCLQLNPELNQSARIPGGAQLIRRVFTPDNPSVFDNIDRTGLRVLVFKPTILAQVRRTLTFHPTDDRNDTNGDWLLSRNHRLGLDAYLANHRPTRPDPDDATEAEVARYFRAVSATADNSNMVGTDLAKYAPRFSRLLALHSQRYACASAIVLGTPDARRNDVLDTIADNPAIAQYLADHVAERGWQGEAAQTFTQLLASEAAGPLLSPHATAALVSALAELEDPDTYPTLLKTLEISNSWRIYDSLRHLPGITPALDETIARMSRELSPDKMVASVRRSVFFQLFDDFRPSVHHGNSEAFGKLLELWELSPRKDLRFGQVKRITQFIQPEPAIPETMDAWNAFLAGKTAADFTHDPLTLKWRASSDAE